MRKSDTTGTGGARLAVGLRVPPCRPVGEVGAFAAEIERLGFDQLYLPDSQLLWRDPYVALSAAAAATSRLVLGTAVTNVVTRHPSVVAGAARTVAELAPGRFRLGLGVGNSSVEPIGLRASTQAQLRAGVEQIRGLLAGTEVDFHGVLARQRDPVPDVPVYIAASGPKNLHLAGEIGDGAMLLTGMSAGLLERGVALVRKGAGGRDIDIVVSAYAKVTDDPERDARELKPVMAAMAQHGGRAALASVGIDVTVPRHVPDVYPDLLHAEDWDAAVERCSEWISDEQALRYADEFCLFGTAERIAERMLRAWRCGASSIYLQHVGSYDLPRQLAADVAAVLPLVH